MSSRTRLCRLSWAMTASRKDEQTTALGAPVAPEVNNNSSVCSRPGGGAGAVVGFAAARCNVSR
ncbi:Uncharacterised protein [Mycobacteroides abscessus subsp. abscessus]|nr:Uncharacterised protein [Mycobacteroides abscessus subsp. abscessus]